MAKARQGSWYTGLGSSWQDARGKERYCWGVGCSCPSTSNDAGLGATKVLPGPPAREGTHSRALNFPNSGQKVLGQKELGQLVWCLPGIPSLHLHVGTSKGQSTSNQVIPGFSPQPCPSRSGTCGSLCRHSTTEGQSL